MAVRPATTAQDPDELFDVVNADGTPTGRTKTRAAVHRDGDWHRAVHIWIAGIDAAGSFLLMQRRSAGKDTWPGRLDITVGGHLSAGETRAEAMREIEEEVGVVPIAAPRFLGIRRAVSEREPGVRDRELQEVFVLRDDRLLTAYRPNPAELESLLRFPLDGLLEFLGGNGAQRTLDALTLDARLLTVSTTQIVPDDFIPTTDRYFHRAAIAADLALRGVKHVAI